MWKVSGGRLVELSAEDSKPPLVLSSTGCYIVCYEFCPGVDARVRRFVIYAWQGAMAARQDIAAGALCLNDVQVWSAARPLERILLRIQHEFEWSETEEGLDPNPENAARPESRAV